MIVDTIGLFVEILTPLKSGIFPLPDAPMPIEGVELVQLKLADAYGLENTISFIALVLQIVISVIGSAEGVGIIVISKSIKLPGQETP